MSIKAILLQNVGAGVWSRSSGSLVRLLQVPLLLSILGVEEYGRWLVLYTLPSWIAFANMGFGNVAANEMSMATAVGDINKARSLFSSTLAVVAGIGMCAMALTAAIAPYLPWEKFLGVSTERHNELTLAVLWLVISTFLSFYIEAFDGRFRAARKAHLGVFIASFRPWLDLSAIITTLHFSSRFDFLALSLFGSTVIYYLFYQWFSRRVMREVSFSFKDVQINLFRQLFRKGIAFQAFPLGNALLFQGNILIVQSILGPVAVAVFATTRTLVRIVNQVMEVINQAISPEMSHLIGAGDMIRAARLHRLGVALSIISACAGTLVLAFWGQALYGIWVGKTINLPQHLLLLFLLPIPLNSLWFTSSVVHSASNQHEGLAIRYIIATVLGAITCIFLSYFQGVEGAALSTLLVDIVLIPYVLKRSLLLTGDTWGNFIEGIIEEIFAMLNLLKKKLGYWQI